MAAFAEVVTFDQALASRCKASRLLTGYRSPIAMNQLDNGIPVSSRSGGRAGGPAGCPCAPRSAPPIACPPLDDPGPLLLTRGLSRAGNPVPAR